MNGFHPKVENAGGFNEKWLSDIMTAMQCPKTCLLEYSKTIVGLCMPIISVLPDDDKN